MSGVGISRKTKKNQQSKIKHFVYLVSKISSTNFPLITQHEHPVTISLLVHRKILRTLKQKLFNKRPLNLLKFVYKSHAMIFFMCAEYARNQNKILVYRMKKKKEFFFSDRKYVGLVQNCMRV